MKTVKKVLLSLVALSLVFACNQDNPIPSTPPAKLHLEAEVIDEGFDSQNFLRLEVTEASNCNVGESVIVTVFGILDTESPGDEIDLPYGEIEFLNRESGCYLIGKFHGKVIAETDRLTLDAIVQIDYGIGVFKADGGELRLNVTGVRIQGDQMRYEILIDGYLKRKGATKS